MNNKFYIAMCESSYCLGVFSTYEKAKNCLYYDEIKKEYEEEYDTPEEAFENFMRAYGHEILELEIDKER